MVRHHLSQCEKAPFYRFNPIDIYPSGFPLRDAFPLVALRSPVPVVVAKVCRLRCGSIHGYRSVFYPSTRRGKIFVPPRRREPLDDDWQRLEYPHFTCSRQYPQREGLGSHAAYPWWEAGLDRVHSPAPLVCGPPGVPGPTASLSHGVRDEVSVSTYRHREVPPFDSGGPASIHLARLRPPSTLFIQSLGHHLCRRPKGCG